MTEADYWLGLEYRLGCEFAGLSERRYRYFWCDGFIPAAYHLDDPSARITGRCWICNGPHQDDWEFVLFLPRSFGSREQIDWASLLPPKNRTCWMAFDEIRRYIEIEPAVAVPDRSDPGNNCRIEA